MANVIRGVPLGPDGYFFLPLWTNWLPGVHPGILDWYTVLGGLFALVALALHGALYIAVKTEGELQQRVRSVVPSPLDCSFHSDRPGFVRFCFRPSRYSGKLPSVSRSVSSAGHSRNFVSRHIFLLPQKCRPKRLHLFLHIPGCHARRGRDRSLSAPVAFHQQSIIGYYDPEGALRTARSSCRSRLVDIRHGPRRSILRNRVSYVPRESFPS